MNYIYFRATFMSPYFINFFSHFYLYAPLPFFNSCQYFHGVSAVHKEAAFIRAFGIIVPLKCAHEQHKKERPASLFVTAMPREH